MGVFMKRSVWLAAFLLICSFGFGQEINFINELAGKKVATFGDGVTMYLYTLGRVPAGFDADVRVLKGLNMLKADRYDRNKPLSRGMLALMVARHLKLKGSLLYLMFDTERYAHRACVAEKIMEASTSELDRLTGDELLEVMTIVAERMEGKK
ncbi:MAG: hypothetical protein A2176_04610 [Spirochaetes bacterium RBG_13_51_14]|nr:MAG: hypothetical protein A2176_04610 [Spirochaetes bacterium RBG_13_51_14]